METSNGDAVNDMVAGTLVGICEGSNAGRELGTTNGVILWYRVGKALIVYDDMYEGFTDDGEIGDIDGVLEGICEGSQNGLCVGTSDGDTVGNMIAAADGAPVGACKGLTTGAALKSTDEVMLGYELDEVLGIDDGLQCVGIVDGDAVGNMIATADGALVGACKG